MPKLVNKRKQVFFYRTCLYTPAVLLTVLCKVTNLKFDTVQLVDTGHYCNYRESVTKLLFWAGTAWLLLCETTEPSGACMATTVRDIRAFMRLNGYHCVKNQNLHRTAWLLLSETSELAGSRH